MQKIHTRLLQLFTWIKSFDKNDLLCKIYLLQSLSNLFIFILIVCLVVYFSKYHLIVLDDTNEIFLDKYRTAYEQLLINVYHGRYVGNFFTKFFGSMLPNIFSIHVNIWIQTFGAVVKGVFLAIFSFLLADWMFIFNKKKFLLLPPLAALFCYFYYQFNFAGMWRDFLYASFFGFTFPFIFFFVYWKLLVEYSFNLKKFNIKYMYLWAFLTGISTEFTSSVSFFAVIMLLIFYKRIFNVPLKPVLYSAISLIIGMILYYTNQGFLFSAHSHGVVFSIKWFLFQAQSVYREFIEGYISVFYSNFFLYLVTIIILLLIIFLTANRDDKYKFCLTITCFTLSAFMFYFMLIFSGDTGFREYSLYVYHFDLIWQMKICLIMIIFFELGILIKNIKVYSICIILIIFFNLCMHQKNITYEILTQNRDLISYIKYKHQNKYYKSIYKDRYFIERIYAYFCYKNVPITIIKTNLYNNNSASEFIPFLEYYLRNVYNNCPEIINKVESNDELYRIYLEAGGPQISDEEIDKADFQALLNKNFVIYGKI